jgi:hypothetical protein
MPALAGSKNSEKSLQERFCVVWAERKTVENFSRRGFVWARENGEKSLQERRCAMWAREKTYFAGWTMESV